MSTDIGFIGLGRMGAAMAERLEAPDVRLHVHDPDGDRIAPFVARGSTRHATPRSLADRAKLVFACLPSPRVSLEVARDAAGGAAIATYVEASTIGRGAVEAIGEIVGTQGVDLVDAPVSGGPEAARSGRLSVMAAGAPLALAEVLPWLDRIAGAVFVVGDSPGLGQTMKLANNLLAAVNLAAGVEALTTAVRSGVDAHVALDVMNASSGRNSATTGLLPRYVATQVLIAGGGPVGITLAMDLARRGVAAIVLEARRDIPPNPRCNTTNARTMEILRNLGCADAVRAAGLPPGHNTDVAYMTTLTGEEIVRFEQVTPAEIAQGQMRGIGADWPTPEPQHFISQLYLEPVLRRRAVERLGVDQRLGWALTDFDQDDEGVTAEIRDVETGETRTVRAAYLVGADGGASLVRRTIGARLQGVPRLRDACSVFIDAPSLGRNPRVAPGWMSPPTGRQPLRARSSSFGRRTRAQGRRTSARMAKAASGPACPRPDA